MRATKSCCFPFIAVVICQLLLASAYAESSDVVAAIKSPPSDILLITMGGTRSHKVPFLALAKGLIAKYANL